MATLPTIGEPPKAAPIADAISVKPVQTQIGDDALVENRIGNLLSSDNPYMREADLIGNQSAASRGLQNSSIAVGEVQRARIQAALPIATTDANTMAAADMQDGRHVQQGALNEQNYGNTAALTNQSFTNQGALQGYNNLFSAQMQKYNNDHQVDMAGINHANNVDMAGVQHGYNANLANLNNAADMAQLHAGAGYEQNLQAQSQVAQMQMNMSNQISAIENNPEMSEAQKQAAIQNIINLNNATTNAIQQSNGLAQTSFTFSQADRGTTGVSGSAGSGNGGGGGNLTVSAGGSHPTNGAGGTSSGDTNQGSL